MPRSACCRLHSSSWHLIRSGWDLLLVMFPFVWVLNVYKLGFGFLELVSTGTRALPFHFLLVSPCSQPTYLQAPGAHPTRFYIWAPYKFLDGCVACASPKSELCPSGACRVVASLTELSPVTRLLRLVPHMQAELVFWKRPSSCKFAFRCSMRTLELTVFRFKPKF